MTGLYRGGNRYHVVFRQIADFSQPAPGGREAAVRAAVVRYVAVLEEYCRSDPYNWFNFYDFWHGADATGGASARASPSAPGAGVWGGGPRPPAARPPPPPPPSPPSPA